jgi:hypothetical protein
MTLNFFDLHVTGLYVLDPYYRGAEVVDPTNIGDPASFPNTHARNRNDRILISDDRAWTMVRSSMKCIRKILVIDFVRARAAAARARDDSCMHA